jgi:signal peptidase I
MLCRQCGINNPESNKICFHCKSPLIALEDLKIDTHLDKDHAQFRAVKNTALRFQFFKNTLVRSIHFFNQQYQFLKRPWLAAWLSIIPGLGQIYNGQIRKAIPFLISFITLITLFIIFIKQDISNWCMYAASGVIIISFMDAFSTAIVKNQRGTVSKRQYFSLFFYGLFLMGFTLLILQWYSHGLFQLININNSSLAPTFQKGDRVCVNRCTYWFHKPQRGDIALHQSHTFSAEDNAGNLFIIGQDNFMERVIGLPGETVEFKDGIILINGTPLPKETYPLVTTSMPGFLKIELPSDSYFILQSVVPQPGDTLHDKFFGMLGAAPHHNASIRDEENWRKSSVIPRDKIIGKSWFIYNPPSHRRFF